MKRSKRYLSESDKWLKQRRRELIIGLSGLTVVVLGLFGIIIYLVIKIMEKL